MDTTVLTTIDMIRAYRRVHESNLRANPHDDSALDALGQAVLDAIDGGISEDVAYAEAGVQFDGVCDMCGNLSPSLTTSGVDPKTGDTYEFCTNGCYRFPVPCPWCDGGSDAPTPPNVCGRCNGSGYLPKGS